MTSYNSKKTHTPKEINTKDEIRTAHSRQQQTVNQIPLKSNKQATEHSDCIALTNYELHIITIN